jgi:uncharacterized Tic20 family protein
MTTQPQPPQGTPGSYDSTWSAADAALPARPSDDERTWGMAAHLGSFLAAWVALGLLAPLLVLLVKGKDSAYVRHHAMESLNFQLNALVWIGIAVVLMLVLVGFVILPLVGLWYVGFVVAASVRANNGVWYRYPAIIRIVR